MPQWITQIIGWSDAIIVLGNHEPINKVQALEVTCIYEMKSIEESYYKRKEIINLPDGVKYYIIQ